MSAATLVFPHQLFDPNPACSSAREVILVEEWLFFRQFRFHKQKILFHRTSMKCYEQKLLKQNYRIQYIESDDSLADIRQLIPYLKTQGVNEIHYCEVSDDWLNRRITETANALQLQRRTYATPMFILGQSDVEQYFNNRKQFLQADFYTHQRKRLNILVDEHLKPVGGKWSFDSENRKKYPKNKLPPRVMFPEPPEEWNRATQYVSTGFRDHYGELGKSFVYPFDHESAEKWLTQFLTDRFGSFGEYEDAIVSNHHILNHSVLTPMLNTGLLTPHQVIRRILNHAEEHKTPMNSVEGFVRQVIGWREFIRGVYQTAGSRQRRKNFWSFKRPVPASFWHATTGIPPVDLTISKVLRTGYCHHIERLMVLGNFMLLCEFDPNDVYRWFMELFIDSYDWVMVPNVYGMSQFADGGLMSTKPYISGSNYILKMSDYKKGPWQNTWDGLFWRFLHVHRDYFAGNYRLGMLIKTFDNMPNEKRQSHLNNAETFLNGLK